MTITAQIRTIKRSDVGTTTTRQAGGIRGVVEALAVAMLKWSWAREARTAISHSENKRHRELRASAQQRQTDALRLTQRIGF